MWKSLLILAIAAYLFATTRFYGDDDYDSEPRHYSWGLGENEARKTTVIYDGSDCDCP